MTSDTLLSTYRVSAARGVGIARRHYDDIAKQARSIAGHEQRYTQLTRGRYEGLLESYVLSDHTAIFVETSNRSIRKQFQILPGHVRIGFLLEDGTCCGNGVLLPTGGASVNLSSTSLDLHFGERYRGCWVTLSEAEVAAVMPVRNELCANGGRYHVRGSAASLLQRAIATACEELFSDDLSVPPERIAACERSIVSAAASVLATAFDLEYEPKGTCAAHRSRLLRRACEVIDARLTSGLTMSQLCSTIGSNRRTLEKIFIDAIGVSPYQYVSALRLNAIRRELASEENSRISISEIAGKWGIWHLSRFAADYRRMFGKLPSQERAWSCGALPPKPDPNQRKKPR
jgi:AraC family ethanolamine operon transcriptional activator